MRCCAQVLLGGRPFLAPSGFTHSLLSSFLSSYQPCRPRETMQGRHEHSVLSEGNRELKGALTLGPTDWEARGPCLLLLCQGWLFSDCFSSAKSKPSSWRESLPVSTLNTGIPVCTVRDHMGRNRAGAWLFMGGASRLAGLPYLSASLLSDWICSRKLSS